ncbi:hypothetical protein BDF20DRAFT_980887 [Mycotypha africana]|uniref:uncharacterized protein n=1 Tax=Mycotypha africana TaxID=64632 RepID=UPI0022FFCCC0|nr:uncharacterized protein BDF20DRAFT_980887 [Mycotypha africana]KAI8969179.1 hypothetical protein BDF20DRAFT_980887 [Mycotypha africana]
MDDISSSTSTPKRRASEPQPTEALALISNRLHNYQRVPPPLPYLPSDYVPSPDSPRQYIIPETTAPNVHNNALFFRNANSDNNQGSNKLVPYREWTVIARNNQKGQLVLYNEDSQSITLRNYVPDQFSNMPSIPLEVTEEEFCPYCHQRLHHTPGTTPLETDGPDYMDRNYFRLLASSSTQISTDEGIMDNHQQQQQQQQQELPSLFDNQNLNANAFNQGYYAKFFDEINKLGKGFRGSVFLCEHRLDGVKLGKYAVKKVAIGNNHPWLVRMLREVHLLERLRHPNIVSYKHSWLEYARLTQFGPEVPCLFILMECANGGNLEEYFERDTAETKDNSKTTQKKKMSAKELKRERIRRQYREQETFEQEQTNISEPITHVERRLLTLQEIWSLFLDIVQGLAHLHQQNIVHRDLKPPNLLLHPRVLISDFGECEDLDETRVDNNRTGATGTLEFMAPEHVRLDPRGRNTVDYSPKADMWSLGMVLYFLCYSRLPYNVIDDVDILREEILAFNEIHFPASRYDIYKDNPTLYAEALNDPKITTDVPKEIKQLIRMLLSLDPIKRPSCNEILSKIQSFRGNEKSPNIMPDDDSMNEDIMMEEREANQDMNVTSCLNREDKGNSSAIKLADGSDNDPSTSFTRLLLDSPPPPPTTDAVFRVKWLSDRQTKQLIKTITAVLKIASCTYPCSPYSANPLILYPTIFFATLDFWCESSSPSFILLLLHVMSNKQGSAVADFVSGNLGGMSQVLVGQPLDTIKVRLQLDQGKFKGIGAVNALLFAANSKFKGMLQSHPAEVLSLDKIALAGAGAGIVNSVLAAPVELLKIKMQAQFGSAAAAATTTEGSKLPSQRYFTGPIDCAKYLIKKDGISHGLFRGLWATMIREIPAYAGFYSGFEFTKRTLTKGNEANVLQLMISGAVGGIAYWTCCYPLDVVKSVVQNQPNPPKGLYISQVMKHIYAVDGMRGLFRGYAPTVLRSVPAAGATFTVYELSMRMFQSNDW